MAASSSSMSDAELGSIYEFAVQLTKDAGQRLADGAKARMAGGGVRLDTQEKDSSVDLVTQADEDVEAFVRAAIATRYPTHQFLGEESYSKGASRDYLVDSAAPTWIVDPLDGTVNYTHLFAMYCVSIGFVVGGRPVIGVVYAPMLNQLFSACRGKGAWLNETTRLPLLHNPVVPPLPANAPAGCIFSCEWGKDRRDVASGGNLGRKVESFVTMATERSGRGGLGGMVHGVRSLGSAAMDLAYTAAGSFDIWWEGGCWEWDVAAGFAILEEAGGLVTTANPPASATGDYADVAVEDAYLGGRLYLAIRPAGPSPSSGKDVPPETGREAQERVVREVWKRVTALDYTRPGV
ncbi:myo-inositol-1(or 4)-monophosphatase [Sporothrix schenckii 1099-18]|uniref:Inositol-1-monophosphatase n=1 Tax=Sporothrix schenckii 1099-18 TaxID=1397361 RepID=A0A0F2LVV0_SPOSC|nr:myo-inositol-1(or 4)-monophosphatase [Sporothrix schenckii 1099-18]KJR81602.1 myo-inositol-1(or 4)-monophosphatase [Sporothrix schenckii 1099-18]